MTCAGCGRANRPGARFCGGCGKPFASHCPTCGAENESDAQFCDACGAGLVDRPTGRIEARKVVTIVFADLIGSTSLHERLDAESVRRLMDRYYQALHSAVEAHGGTVVKLLGDGVMAAFGVPRVAEDDAIRAVRAAVAMQDAFRELVQEQRANFEPSPSVPPLPLRARGPGGEGFVGLRVAVNTGEVVVSDDHADVVGDPVNVAARLQQEAHDGDVLIGESTRRLVSELVTLAPFGALALKGRSEKVSAYRVVSLDRPAGAPATPFVGRDDELRRLKTVYHTAVTARTARLAVILGSPGLGKSRLLAEFARLLGDGVSMITARCDAAGGTTFAPLADAMRVFLRVDDSAGNDDLRKAIDAAVRGDDTDHSRIVDGVAALLAGTPSAPEETFFVVRRFLGALAARQPVVLAIDDLQWAEPLLLDLTEHLVQWSTDVPLLILAAARPELRDVRASLTSSSGFVAAVVTLGGLDAGAATRLAANVVGTDELPAALAGRVLAASEGNPLFVGELVRMLVHDGALVRDGDRWTTGVALADLEMPPTIHALLAARIERLRPEDCMVLERAAVIGRHFSRAAVAHLLPQEMTDLDARFESLRRSELIEPDTGWFLGEPVLRFHHVLIRDAAYRRLLKGTRAELHGRFADWLERRVGATIEHDETIGWHLEQAHQHLRELGPIDEHGRAFGARAARYLAAAGKRALARDDLPLAASLLGRALKQLDSADLARADLALDWCEALLASGDVGPAARAIDELSRFTGGSDRLRAWHTCFIGQLAVLTDPQALRATADAVAVAGEELGASGDAAGEAKAHSVHALALQRLGKIGAAEGALDRALAAARRAHDRRRANTVLAGAPPAALWGPSPVTRASGRCLDVVRVLRITQGAPAVEAVALRCQGALEALRGRLDAARRMIASSRRMVEELGITQRLLEADVFAGFVELLDGNAAAAERCLRTAYDGLRTYGLGIDAAQAAALLGRALLAQDRSEEAERLSHESEALAGDDLKAAIAWRGVRAEALARRGEHLAAIDFARAAVDIAAATDALLDHADARSTLASVLRAAGRNDEAAAEEALAIELWETKGATLLSQRARHDAIRAPAQSAPLSDDRVQPTRAPRRRVRPNAATANTARLDAAMAACDADSLPALLADTLEIVHHPTGTVYDRHAGLAAWHTLLGARDLRFAHEPVATLGDSLALFRTSVSFSALPDTDAGAASWNEVLLIEVDSRGQRRRVELFTADKLGSAIARFYERYADLLPDGPERTRAAATARSIGALLGPPSLDSYGTAFAPDFEFVDQRVLGFGSGRGAELAMRTFELLFESSTDVVVAIDEILGLRPGALLTHFKLSALDRASGGRYERDFLVLWIFGSDGLVTRSEQWDPDRDAEAIARYDELSAKPTTPAGIAAPATRRTEPEPASSRRATLTRTFTRAFAARDWQALTALLAPELIVTDHRLLGWETLHGPAAYIEALKSLIDLAPDVQLRIDHVTMVEPRFLYVTTWVGTHEGGRFESPSVILCELDTVGRIRRFDQYDIDRRDEIAAKFEAVHRDPLRIPPNAATRAMDRWEELAVVGDWDGLRRLFSPAMVYDDRRRLFLVGGDRDMAVANSQLIAAAQTRASRTLLATSGDMLALERVLFANSPEGAASEIETLQLIEVDRDGRIVAAIAFDPDNRRAASLEMFDRYFRGEGALWTPPSQIEFVRALNDHDLDRARAALPDDFFFHDHRRTGVGRIGNVDDYIASLAAVYEQSPDATTDTLYHVAVDKHGSLSVGRMFGTLVDAGPFESVFVRLNLYRENRGAGAELFEVDDLDLARARFEELRPGVQIRDPQPEARTTSEPTGS